MTRPAVGSMSFGIDTVKGSFLLKHEHSLPSIIVTFQDSFVSLNWLFYFLICNTHS
jgi:hypothetical protein